MSEDKAAVEKLHASYGRMKDELSQVIVGQHEVVEQASMAMFCRGHALLAGAPGSARERRCPIQPHKAMSWVLHSAKPVL